MYPTSFTIITQTDPVRRRAEGIIRTIFTKQYGASVGEFAPTLVALKAARDGDRGNISCVAGLRFATDGFFSERYLDQPIEALLGPLWNTPVRREQIAEVTNLAGMKARSSHLLIANIIQLCRGRSIQWAFFTAGERLRAVLRRTGILTLDLGPALAERIGNADAWGSYYATNPHVVAIHDSMITMGGISPDDSQAPSLVRGSVRA